MTYHMNMQEAAALIEKAKYHDWVFSPTVYPIHMVVTIGFWAENSDEAFKGSRQPSKSWVSLEFAIDARQVACMTEYQLMDWVYSHVKQMVLHEAGEWFIWNGERHYYPHARHVGGAVTFP